MAKSSALTAENEAKKVLDLRFGHRQPEIWTQAFSANKRVWLGMYCLMGILAVSFALNVVQAGRPANVILVDKLGQAEFYHEAASPEPAQDYEAKHFAEYWVKLFLSRDAITAKDDLATALTLSHPQLQKILRDRLISSGELDKLRDAFVHTTIRCTEISIVRAASDRMQVAVTGTRTFTALDPTKKQMKEPFKFQLVLDATPRTEHTPNGLLVRYITGQWGSNDSIDEKTDNHG